VSCPGRLKNAQIVFLIISQFFQMGRGWLISIFWKSIFLRIIWYHTLDISSQIVVTNRMLQFQINHMRKCQKLTYDMSFYSECHFLSNKVKKFRGCHLKIKSCSHSRWNRKWQKTIEYVNQFQLMSYSNIPNLVVLSEKIKKL